MSEIRRSEESQQEIKQEYKTMTFEEYQGHETPYVYEVKKGGPLENILGFPYVKEIHTKVYEENLKFYWKMRR